MSWWSSLTGWGGGAQPSYGVLASDVAPMVDYGALASGASGYGVTAPQTYGAQTGISSIGSVPANQATGGGSYLGDISKYYKQGKGAGGQKSQDPTGEAILKPQREARERYLALMPRATHVGESLGVGGPGDAERARFMETYEESMRAKIANKLRQYAAEGNTAQQSLGLIKDLVSNYYTGGGSGMGGMMGGMGGGGGGGMGGMFGGG